MALLSRVAAQVPTPTHVACVGDSITAGLFASSPAASYPSVMQNLFGSAVNVQNFGHSGATMMTVADQPYQNTAEYTNATTFVAGAGASAVVDVVIMGGTNDSKSYNWMVGNGTRAQQFVTDCGALVDHFASQSTHLEGRPGPPAAGLRQHVRNQRCDHPRSDAAVDPPGRRGQGGAGHRRRYADRAAPRSCFPMGCTLTTPATLSSRK